MISLEQIRLLEGKITRAIDLIRVLKDENGTLRRGLDSAQKRMKELEALVDGFKADQKEIESVIVRTLRHLDDLEEGSGTAARSVDAPHAAEAPRSVDAPHATPPRTAVAPTASAPQAAPAPQATALHEEQEKPAGAPLDGTETRAHAQTKEELDIF
jgi:FtsZ-binding cell division protein ZapB